MNLSVLLAYILAIVVLIGTPGPIVALVLNAASRHGFKYALSTILGSNLASLLLLAGAALIIAGVIALDTHSLQWVTLLGCVFIGWLALKGLAAEWSVTAQPQPAIVEAGKNHAGFLNSFLLGLSNPKDIVFFVAFFPQFIEVTSDFTLSLGVLTLVWIVVDFLILLSYVLLVRGRFFQQQQRKVSILSSLFLLLIAIVGAVYTLLNWQAAG